MKKKKKIDWQMKAKTPRKSLSTQLFEERSNKKREREEFEEDCRLLAERVSKKKERIEWKSSLADTQTGRRSGSDCC